MQSPRRNSPAVESGPSRSPPVHAAAVDAVAARLSADPERGLEAREAAERLARHGPNRPRPLRRPPYARIAAAQLFDPMVALLSAAVAVSLAIGDTLEGVTIGAIVFLNALLGSWQEAKAERAIRALAQAFTQNAVVVRDGEEQVIAAEEVVPGDVLLVGEGDRIAADLRLTDASALAVDQSALTGESLSVEKCVNPVPIGAPLAERGSMLYAGTGVTRGRGRGLVCAVGADTELGRIAMLAADAPAPATPLTRRLRRLARAMALGGVGITVVLAGVLLLRGADAHMAFLTGVAVAVAAVPEGLSATVTAALAMGARAMTRRGAIVRRLAAIETLGETTVICTDKTGTLTENKITVAELLPAVGFDEARLLEAAVRASAAHETGGGMVGDPDETALLREALKRGSGAGAAPAGELIFEIPFDSDRKRMTRVWRRSGTLCAFTKGAPEAVAELAAEKDVALLEAAAERAERGFRVLAVSERQLNAITPLDKGVEAGGVMIGIVVLHDPLRASSAEAVAASRRAGIEVRMVTGDHPATARTIGHAIGLADDAIVARASPADKLALVTRLQGEGQVVAVTGDGVNDAPALRRADVGVAMGASGTEAAREAAGIVLTDDNFATIVAAIAEGRRIGNNIRKFVAFLLSANFGEVLAFAVAIAAGLGPPLAVVQMLVVNLVTDGLPAIALAQDPASPSTMRLPPRRESEMLDRRLRLILGFVGVTVGAVTLISFEVGRSLDGGVAQTMAFATLATSELALVFAFRSQTDPVWRLPANRWLNRGVAVSLAIVAAAIYLPFLNEPLSTVPLSAGAALAAAGLAFAPLVLLGLVKLVWRSRTAA